MNEVTTQVMKPGREINLGTPSGPVRIGIAAARFNQFITDQLPR